VHPWVTREGRDPLPSEPENCNPGPIEVTEEEVRFSVRSIPKLDTLILVKAMLKKHSFKNPFNASAASSSAGTAVVPSSGSGCSSGQQKVVSEQDSRSSLSEPNSYECLAKRYMRLRKPWHV
jgi:[calcium/calmodulin-dependent protein kinase] kinase